ncbi:hypothetical protein Csa_009085, partial [Cucumis sativus]
MIAAAPPRVLFAEQSSVDLADLTYDLLHLPSPFPANSSSFILSAASRRHLKTFTLSRRPHPPP